jgi:hypothetical protein
LPRFVLPLAFALAGMWAAPPQSGSDKAASQAVSPQRMLVDKYCVSCHNQKAKMAGLMLDKMDLNHVPQNAEVWEKVIRKLRGGMMPPLGMWCPFTG